MAHTWMFARSEWKDHTYHSSGKYFDAMLLPQTAQNRNRIAQSKLIIEQQDLRLFGFQLYIRKIK